MKLAEIIHQIDENQSTIASYGKFDAEILKKINYKLRLDWNYYSNRIEGGTLTREETRSVMVGNIDVRGKPIRDVMEMNGHDQVVREILQIGKGKLKLSEKRIKEIHTAIMYEEDHKVEIGKWKSLDNEIIGYKDEKITFAAPPDVPELIHDLLDRTHAALNKIADQKRDAIHPILLAANFHVEYLTIHPFFDGNGRTARILTNLMLISCGFPAIIIKDSLKETYYQYLGDIQAYGGNKQLLQAFIADRVLESQKLVLDALEGKDIEDPDDLEKSMLLLKQELATKEQITIPRSWENLYEVITTGIVPIIDEIETRVKSIEELFDEVSPHISLRFINSDLEDPLRGKKQWRALVPEMLTSLKEAEDHKKLHLIRYSLQFKGFKYNLNSPYFSLHLEFQFDEYDFSLKNSANSQSVKYPYKAKVLQDDTPKIVWNLVEKLMDDIRRVTELEK